MREKLRCFFLLSFSLFSILISQGCYQTLNIGEMAGEYTSLLGSKSIQDLSIEKINKVRLSFNTLTPNNSSDIISYNDSNVHFKAGASNLLYSRALTQNSSLSFNLGQTGFSPNCNRGFTAGMAYKRGLQMDEEGNYWLVARVGYDYLQESLSNFRVEEGYKVDNVQLHEGTLEIALSRKMGLFKPFLTQQMGLAYFTYSGGQSGNYVPPLKDLLMTGLGVEMTFDEWGITLATKMKTSSSSSYFTSLGFYKNF